MGGGGSIHLKVGLSSHPQPRSWEKVHLPRPWFFILVLVEVGMTFLQGGLRKMTWDTYCMGNAQPLPDLGNEEQKEGKRGRLHRGRCERIWRGMRAEEGASASSPGLRDPHSTLKGQGQMVSSAQRYRPVKTGNGGEAGAGDTGLGKPALHRSHSDGIQWDSQRVSWGWKPGVPRTRRQGERLGKGRVLKYTTMIIAWSPQQSTQK